MEVENLLSSMSTTFNASPAPAIDLNLSDDKTIKWRRHFKNQYARKNRRKSAEADGSVAVAASAETIVEDMVKKAETDDDQQVEKITPTAPFEPPSTASTDNSVADNSNKETEGEALKPKKVKKMESPSRRSKRTKVELNVLDVPKRRGRSKKLFESVVTDEKQQTQLETADSHMACAPVQEIVEVVKKEKKSPTSADSNDNRCEQEVKMDLVEIPETIVNGNASKTSNGDESEEGPVIKREMKRRSVRLETKSDGQETSPAKPSTNDVSQIQEEISKPLENIVPSIKETEIQKFELNENELKVAEKTPRKRGRRSKPVVVSSPETNSDSRAQNKKSHRLSKDSIDNSLPNPIARKGKVNDKPALSSQRPLRRIKPTVKILENEELRYEFESKNVGRIVAANEKIIEVDTGRLQRKESKDYPTEIKNNTTPIKKKLLPTSTNYLNVDTIYVSKSAKPCPDPQDFLNEIKAAGINLHRSPEDKKLNRKQHRQLIKQKEKLFERLGLRRNLKGDGTDSDNSSSDGEEFIPSKKINVVGKPNVTLRIRNNKENSSTFVDVPKPHLRPTQNKVATVEMVATKSIVLPSPSALNKDTLNLICSCQVSSQFYASRTSTVVYCSAIDHVENHKVGCCNQVNSRELIPLLRPSQRVPYLVLCELHKKRLAAHNSCAGCGVFCTQGNFILCKHQHFFHPACAQKLILNTPYDPANRTNYPSPTLVLKCPHCGCDTPEKESLITMKCRTAPVYLPSQKGSVKPAKMGISQRHRTLPAYKKKFLQRLDLVKLIPESVMNVVIREGACGGSNDDFTTKDMFYSINNDDLERVAEIIASGYDITCKMPEFLNGTCLHLVAHFGTIQMAYLLLCKNSNPDFLNLVDKELRTSAMCSIIGDKCDILKLFIQCGANISLKGPDGMTCLHFATRSGNLPASQILIESYSSSATLKNFYDFINARDEGGWTALVWAVELGHTDIVSLLVNYGADLSICDMENNTALHWGVISACDDVVNILLQANANCNVQNISGETPLHIACRQSSTNTCLMLLARGADVLLKNNEGQLPYDCVRHEDDPCARAIGFNMQMQDFSPAELQNRIACSDISNGREYYPIQVVRRERSFNCDSNDDDEDDTILPDFRYITKTILLQNSIQIDYRVSQMRICSCNDSCNSDKCQCSTISVQNWYTADGRLNGDFNFDDPAMIFECNDVCGCNKMNCKNRVVQNGIQIPLQVFECTQRTKGWGVRSLRSIPSGSFVAEYTGEILTDMEADRRTDDSYFFDLGSSEHCIDANYYGNVSRFFNHACLPNIVPVRVYFDHQDYRFPKIAFFACMDIAAGEELAFDYGEKFWAVKQKDFACMCGSTECRFTNQPKLI